MIDPRYQEFVSRQLPIVLGLALFGCIGLVTERMLNSQKQSARMAINNDLRSDLYTVREKIDQSLSTVIHRKLGLNAYIQAKQGQIEPAEMSAMLAALYDNSDHIRNFGLAKGTTLAFIYPMLGNEAALGKDYRDVPDQWPDVLAAMNSASGVLSAPVSLIQGGVAFIYRSPIRVDGDYWGLLSTVIDVDSYLQDIATSRMFADGQLAIRTVSGGSVDLLFGEASVFENTWAQRVDVEVPGGYWELAIASKQEPEYPVLSTWRVLGWALAVLLGTGVATILIQRRALQRLNDAQRRLEDNRDGRIEEDTQSALDQARSLADRQEAIREQVGDRPVLDRSVQMAAPERPQPHPSVVVLVVDARDHALGDHGDRQLLVALPHRGVGRALAGIDLAAGKLPPAAHERCVGPPGDQHPRRIGFAVDDDGEGDLGE
jgi:sensor domain CHASE-containing protein